MYESTFRAGEPAGGLVGTQPAAAVRELLDRVAEPYANAGAVPVAVTWAPGDACTLPTAEQPLREAEFNELFTTALRRHQRREPGWLRLHLDPAAETSARDLAARESSCCSFFDFRFTSEEGLLVLDVRVPEAHAPVLDGLVRQVESAQQPPRTRPTSAGEEGT